MGWSAKQTSGEEVKMSLTKRSKGICMEWVSGKLIPQCHPKFVVIYKMCKFPFKEL